MDPSSRQTAAATVVVVVLVALAIAVLVAVGGGGSGGGGGGGGGGVASGPVDPTSPGTTTASQGAPTTAPNTSPVPGTPVPTPGETVTRGDDVCVPQVTERSLRVMTFNIKSGRVTGTVDMGKVGTQVASYQPDIVLVQEIETGRPISRYIDEPSVLAAQLGMAYTFGGNDAKSATNLLGNAVMSRYPILKSANTQLPAQPGKHRRGILGALVDVGGIQLEIFSTHLEHTSGDDRERQVAAIADLLGPRRAPRILGGDFNSVPGGSVMAKARTVATDTWLAVGSGAGFTAPSGNPRIRIDYLMYRGSAKVEITPVQMQVLPTSSSDHRAVMATYTVRQDDGEVCVPIGDGS